MKNLRDNLEELRSILNQAVSQIAKKRLTSSPVDELEEIDKIVKLNIPGLDVSLIRELISASCKVQKEQLSNKKITDATSSLMPNEVVDFSRNLSKAKESLDDAQGYYNKLLFAALHAFQSKENGNEIGKDSIENFCIVKNSDEYKKLMQEAIEAVTSASKAEIDLNWYFKLWNNQPYPLCTYTAIQDFNNRLMESENIVYDLSFKIQQLLFDNNAIIGAEVSLIETWIANRFACYGLSYPLTWDKSINFNNGDISYTCDSDDKIEIKNASFKAKIDRLLNSRKIDEFTYARLIRAAEFMKQYRMNYSRYKLGTPHTK